MDRIAVLLIALCSSHMSLAGPRAGLIDPTFGEEGVSTYGFDLVPDGADTAWAFAEDAQGRFYLVGSLETGADARCVGVARFSPDGAIDEAYGTGGTGCVPLDPALFAELNQISDAAIRSDGTLLFSGSLAGDPTRPFVCHFTASGELDAEFSTGDTPGCHILSVEAGNLHPDWNYDNRVMLTSVGTDAVIVLNGAQEGGDFYQPLMLQLDASGNIVSSNGPALTHAIPDTFFQAFTIRDVDMSSSGMLILAGLAFDGVAGQAVVARFDLTTSKLDTKFNGVGYFIDPNNDHETLIASVNYDDTILIAGTTEKSGRKVPSVFRLTSAGQADPSFNGGKPKTYDPCGFMLEGCLMVPSAIATTRGGKIVVGGFGTFNTELEFDMWALRLHDNGKPDQEFGSTVLTQDGFARVDTSPIEVASGLSLQGEKVVLAGWRGTTQPDLDFALVRLADGSLFRDGME